MSNWEDDNPFDYLPPQSQRYWQRSDMGSFSHGPPSSYVRTRTQAVFRQSHLLEQPTDLYNRVRMAPRFPQSSPPENLSFQSSHTPGFPRSRLPPSSRRPIGGELEFNILPTRVIVYEETVRANGFPTQPPDRSSIPWHMQRQRSRQSPGNESKLTAEEQSKVLAKLRKEKYKQRQGEEGEEGKRCSVCLEDFVAKEEVAVTPCRHLFHGDCIVPWVTREGSCPVCRSVFLERKKADDGGVGPPAVDRELIAMVRALGLDDEDDVGYRNMILPLLLGR